MGNEETWRVGTHMKNGDIYEKCGHILEVKSHIGNENIHKKWRYKWGVGTYTDLGYIQKGNIKLT